MRWTPLLALATCWWPSHGEAPPHLRGRTGRRMASQEAHGDVWILLDFTVAPWARLAQQHFAADLVGNASSEAGSDWHLSFGVVIFHENASYELELSDDYIDLQAELLDPYFGENLTSNLNHSELAIWPGWWWNDWNHTWQDGRYLDSPWLPRNTHLALEICDDFFAHDHYSAVVLLTNGSAADWWHTMKAAEKLKEQDALIYSIGLDLASERSWNRTQELQELASDDATQYDALLWHPHHEHSRRLAVPTPLAELPQLLAQDVVQQLTLLEAADATSSWQPWTSTQAGAGDSSSTTSSPGGTGGAEPSSGLAGGIVVLIVLLSCCCVSFMIGVAFYFYKQEQKRKTAISPTPVVPVVAPTAAPPEPAVAPPRPPAPAPKDATQKGLQEAIDMKDLEKLRSCLSELLLQGWPDEKYSDLILKALDTVASLKSSTTTQLESAVSRGQLPPSLAPARLCGVEPQLLRRAEELRQEELM